MLDLNSMVQKIICNSVLPTTRDNLPSGVTDIWNGISGFSKFHKLTNLYLVDEVPEVKGTCWGGEPIVLENAGSLDFWNDIEGFFIYASTRCANVVDKRTTNWEIPNSVELKPEHTDDRKPGEYIVGDAFVDKDYNVYIITDGPGVKYTCTCEKCGYEQIVDTRNYVPTITAYGYINAKCHKCGGDSYAPWFGHNGGHCYVTCI